MKKCKQCQSSFEVTDADRGFYEKMDVPEPTLCPDCRNQRRMSWRNEQTFHKRKCDLCEKEMISTYPEKAPFPVYCQSCWWSDRWNPLSYGKEFDFSRSFFEQYTDMMKKVPHRALFITGENENSEYTNCAGSNKNCYYLLGNCGWNESCLFGNGVSDSVDCMEVYFGQKNELCYEIINCSKCYNLRFSQNCSLCSDSWFLRNCSGCKNCFGCANLNNKEYHFLNRKMDKGEYEAKILELKLDSFKTLKKIRENFPEFFLKYPVKYSEIIGSENCSGNWISNSKNCEECYEISAGEDCKWCYCTKDCKDSYDFFGFGYHSERIYESVGSGEGMNIRFCFACDRSSDITYCSECNTSQDLFGCYGLRKNQYCILNRQYLKDEYEELQNKIMEHMKKTGEYGEFFPLELSPFAYNETIAQEHYPLNKKEVSILNGKWQEDEESSYQTESYHIPDLISETEDNILKKVLACEKCRKAYRIVAPELHFYRKMNLPVPHECLKCRFKNRKNLRIPYHLFQRKCANCSAEIQTTYSPDRPEKVYCEACYLKEVY